MPYIINQSDSETGFDHTPNIRSAGPVISPVFLSFSFNANTERVIMVDGLLGITWELSGPGLNAGTLSLAALLDIPLARATSTRDTALGVVVTQIEGRSIDSVGASMDLTLGILTTTRWADLLDAGGDRVRLTEFDDEISTFDGNDIIFGFNGNDTIFAGDGKDRLVGGKGRDTLDGGNGNDVIRGDAGDDILNGRNGKDNISGGKGADIIDGGARSDFILGDAGNDFIDGGGGQDVLRGGKGADTLRGGEGSDKLKGNAGADTFVFSDGRDVIVDFQDDLDKIVIVGFGFSDAETVLNERGSISNGNAIIQYGNGDQLVVNGVTNLDILIDDIEFG